MTWQFYRFSIFQLTKFWIRHTIYSSYFHVGEVELTWLIHKRKKRPFDVLSEFGLKFLSFNQSIMNHNDGWLQSNAIKLYHFFSSNHRGECIKVTNHSTDICHACVIFIDQLEVLNRVYICSHIFPEHV